MLLQVANFLKPFLKYYTVNCYWAYKLISYGISGKVILRNENIFNRENIY